MRPIVWFSLAASWRRRASLLRALPPRPKRIIIRTGFVYIDPRPPLTVNRRSWLDPGPVVPEGSMQDYMTENTIFNQTPDQADYRSRFGNETLPRRFDLPGRREPLVEFWTPTYPY